MSVPECSGRDDGELIQNGLFPDLYGSTFTRCQREWVSQNLAYAIREVWVSKRKVNRQHMVSVGQAIILADLLGVIEPSVDWLMSRTELKDKSVRRAISGLKAEPNELIASEPRIYWNGQRANRSHFFYGKAAGRLRQLPGFARTFSKRLSVRRLAERLLIAFLTVVRRVFSWVRSRLAASFCAICANKRGQCRGNARAKEGRPDGTKHDSGGTRGRTNGTRGRRDRTGGRSIPSNGDPLHDDSNNENESHEPGEFKFTGDKWPGGVTKANLADPATIEAAYKCAVRIGWLSASEDNLLNVFAAAVQAQRGDNPPGLFRYLVHGQRWIVKAGEKKSIAESSYDDARRMIKRLKSATRSPLPRGVAPTIRGPEDICGPAELDRDHELARLRKWDVERKRSSAT